MICFGELMLRLSPEGYNRFVQADKFDINYGGSEANVALSLVNYNMNSTFITKLPSNEIGQSALNKLRQYGVNTSKIKMDGERIGIYYMEKGASQRPSKVIYDRSNSAISNANLDDFNWDEIFNNAKWFHFSGITPALSDNLAEICLEACKKAKKNNITVSCDLNYRSKLWSEKKANKVMTQIMNYVDVCVANEEDIEKVFGIKAEDTDVSHGKINYDSYKSVAEEVLSKFNLSMVACNLRTSISASDNKLLAVLYDGNKFYQSKEYDVHIVDRVGGGDSFLAGLIYGLLNNKSNQEALEFATAAGVLKHSIEGDFNMVTVSEVENLASGDSSGRVQR
ncbi:MAG: sugar kinase [Methanobacteriaceae archaeon]|nr:sugar kinase [Methanobacteriaceae archaeon]